MNCRGPEFGKLAKGVAVTTAAGNVVQPEMCMEAAVLGECVTVIDCPSAAYIPALAAAMESVNTLMQDPDGNRVKTVFHVGPEDVVMHEEYQGSLLQLQQCKHFAAEKTFDPSLHAPSMRKAVLLQVQSCRPCSLKGTAVYSWTLFCIVTALFGVFVYTLTSMTHNYKKSASGDECVLF